MARREEKGEKEFSQFKLLISVSSGSGRFKRQSSYLSLASAFICLFHAKTNRLFKTRTLGKVFESTKICINQKPSVAPWFLILKYHVPSVRRRSWLSTDNFSLLSAKTDAFLKNIVEWFPLFFRGLKFSVFLFFATIQV